MVEQWTFNPLVQGSSPWGGTEPQRLCTFGRLAGGTAQTVANLRGCTGKSSPWRETAQVSYNLLNPSAGTNLPSGYPAQDYGNLLARAHAGGVGTIGIRVLAGGALSGVETRHPLGMPSVDPIGSASTYAGDVARARRFNEVVSKGFAQNLVEASIRFVLSNQNLSTMLVGFSTFEQLEHAGRSAEKGPLPAEALKLMSTIQQGFVGEPR